MVLGGVSANRWLVRQDVPGGVGAACATLRLAIAERTNSTSPFCALVTLTGSSTRWRKYLLISSSMSMARSTCRFAPGGRRRSRSNLRGHGRRPSIGEWLGRRLDGWREATSGIKRLMLSSTSTAGQCARAASFRDSQVYRPRVPPEAWPIVILRELIDAVPPREDVFAHAQGLRPFQ